MSFSYIQSVLPRIQNTDERSIAAHMLRIAEMLPRVISDQREETIAQIHNLAGSLSYYEDKDLGALALEAVGDLITEKEFQKIIYTHALYRARWCAQSGTSGGESLARANHIHAIEAKKK
jgi:hypothetical protein